MLEGGNPAPGRSEYASTREVGLEIAEVCRLTVRRGAPNRDIGDRPNRLFRDAGGLDA